MRGLASAFFLTLLLCWPSMAAAQTGECDALKGAQKELAAAILKSQHPYACCDQSLDKCLAKRPVCRLARRLASDVCRRVAGGQDRVAIERELARRATSMAPSAKRYTIDLSSTPAAGDPSAKVTVVAYACARCPYCARMIPRLYQAVTTGALRGKAKLTLKFFPLRSHVGSTEAAMGAMAAARLGRFWPFVLKLYEQFDSFDANKLPEYAAAVGADPKRFNELTRDAAVRQQLLQSKKEGVRNGVEATPALFIDGRRYTGELALPVVVDVLEEEYDGVTGKTYE
jgi:protein-disulfide isomerase